MGLWVMVVVLVAPLMMMVPFITLWKHARLASIERKHPERVCTHGVTETVNGGGCTELVRMIGPFVELLSSVTPQMSIAVVVTASHISAWEPTLS